MKGKSGIEFILKGDINSYEVPPLIGVITGIDNSFSRHFIDYDLGNSLDYVTEMAEKAKEGDDNSHYNDLLDSLPEKVKNEQKRLGSADDVDIYLTHKLPNCEKSAPKNRKVYGCPTGDIAKEYSEHASCTYGGHFHSMQVGDNFLETLLESNDFEIDEDGWNVIYVEDEQLKFINSAGDGFTVTEFDEDKSIECIMVYELIDVYD